MPQNDPYLPKEITEDIGKRFTDRYTEAPNDDPVNRTSNGQNIYDKLVPIDNQTTSSTQSNNQKQQKQQSPNQYNQQSNS